MTLIALGLLALGTLCGWGGHAAWVQDRKNKALRRMIAEARADGAMVPGSTWVVEESVTLRKESADFTDEAWFTGKPKVTLLPGDFDDRA